jgi:hypothetical protein
MQVTYGNATPNSAASTTTINNLRRFAYGMYYEDIRVAALPIARTPDAWIDSCGLTALAQLQASPEPHISRRQNTPR